MKSATNLPFLLTISTMLILMSGQSAFAQSGMNCHCFQDRDYKPSDRFAADDYMLATSFNSLLARSFAISKGQVVMLKMNQGVEQNDLLIGLQAAHDTDTTIDTLLGLRRANKTWQEILNGLQPQDRVKKDPALAGLLSGMPADRAGALIADAIIARFFAVPPKKISTLSSTGMNEKEMTLLFILAHAGGQTAEELAALHRENGKSWSEIAHDLGIEPAAAGKLILAYPARQIPE